MTGRLNPAAREQLRSAGVSEVEWTRRYFAGTDWGGDECGCPDDRCIGHHHDESDECGCLASLLRDDLEQNQAVLFVAVERDPKRDAVPYRFLCGNCNRYAAAMPGDLCPDCLAPARKAG